MAEKLKIEDNKNTDEGHVAIHPVTMELKSGDPKPGTSEFKVVPHNMDSEVTTSVMSEKLRCPKCGKSALHAEFPDQYEAWTKCSACGFFMGMGNEEWHRMENSPNINEKIKKMAIKLKLITTP
ncbi:MAG TPA: hypothetical protein VN372_10240 [Methanospirillum sp.]|nr:hypothetical protein [Methanospirillum sp.]